MVCMCCDQLSVPCWLMLSISDPVAHAGELKSHIGLFH